MRQYRIDYMNSLDQTLYDEIMEPDYMVHINGMSLVRSTTYAQAVHQIFNAAPGLGILVHDFVLNGDRLCMHFSEHAGMPAGGGWALACWRGIGLYKWNGKRLTENYVEQDYFAMQVQMTSRHPHPLIPPHIDPWTSTEPVPADPDAEATVRTWLEKADADVPFHVTMRGPYWGGLGAGAEKHIGKPATLHIAGILVSPTTPLHSSRQ